MEISKKRKNIENNSENDIKKTKSIITGMDECETCNDSIEDILNELSRIDLNDINNIKNVVYDNEIKSYRLDNMYNFNFIKFMREIESLDHDVDKIYPFRELMMLTSMCFFNIKVTAAIRNYLGTEKNINIMSIRTIEMRMDEIITVVYDEDYIVCNLELNINRFWFYNPSRFCNELMIKLKLIEKKEEKMKIKNKILEELEYCISQEMISNFYRIETLSWIGFYKNYDTKN